MMFKIIDATTGKEPIDKDEIYLNKNFITIDDFEDKIKTIRKIDKVKNKRLYRNLFINNKQRRINRWK